MALEQNEISVLCLVASDISYRPEDLFNTAPYGPLSSFTDNFPEREFGFPQVLVSNFSNLFGSPTAYLLDKEPATEAIVVVFSGWEFVTKFQDSENGFGAIVYQSTEPIAGKTHYIVAFQGSDGLNGQDWIQNLDLARDVWGKETGAVTEFLVGGDQVNLPGIVPSTGVIHFTGQSLGGGLAQYAAYDYVARMTGPTRPTGSTFRTDTDVSLVTFNGFGAVKGLMDQNGFPLI